MPAPLVLRWSIHSRDAIRALESLHCWLGIGPHPEMCPKLIEDGLYCGLKRNHSGDCST